jgi:hypothetical protein
LYWGVEPRAAWRLRRSAHAKQSDPKYDAGTALAFAPIFPFTCDFSVDKRRRPFDNEQRRKGEIMQFSLMPRGAISEVSGPSCSGRTGLIHRMLAEAGAAREFCAVIDAAGSFDPLSAAQAGVDLSRLLWVRGNARLDPQNLTHVLKAADLILHAGGFGLVVLDLCDVAVRDLNRIPISYWHRFRLAVERTPARLLVAAAAPLAKSCARLQLETTRERALWRGLLFGGIESAAVQRKQFLRMVG